MFPNKDSMMRGREEIQPEDLLPYLPATMEAIIEETGLSKRKVETLLLSLRRMGLAHLEDRETRAYWFPAALQKGGGST